MANSAGLPWLGNINNQAAAPAQAQQWNLEAKSPQPQPLVKQSVVPATTFGPWLLLYPVPQGSYVVLQEILLGNMTASDVDYAFAFLDDDDVAPSGVPAGNDNVVLMATVPAGESLRLELTTGLISKWRIYGYSSAAAGEKANVLITGLVVSYL